MNELRFRVLGSDNKPQDVVFRKNGKEMTAICGCATGVDGICQHWINILSGSTKEIISSNVDEVRTVVSWVAKTEVGVALREVVKAAKCLENANDDLINARGRLVKSLQHG